ncbi:FAD/FMN-containing dehydrogenase [Nonomuraea fuscirosea]|uniref:FAD/FMN-containing dehydrogenase n=1 Tax=Nonomuraea fuscirosea TaxID=1291556 RepID=A0A2T0ME42_9ACTN|nr:FAD-binding protein [Nonomuraea fuscirosea]PRX55815.1 FAD/FMN-containing dehydrogenase [Nonomuraea fuscirosea]
MKGLSRRGLLGGAAAATGAVAVTLMDDADAAAATRARDRGPVAAPATVYPSDPRYQELTVGYNQRWVGRPDYVRVVSSTEQVVAAVQEAVDTGRRVSVVSGGHCLAPFVFNDEVKMVIDLAGLNDVYFDTRRGAFAVEGGARLSNVYETLYKKWGVTIPGGMCPTVGIGGHTTGGGYGFLSRQFGAVIDHLAAVEVVVVDRSRTARAIVATSDPDDPHHALWWACAGGGGGNFGVVTRFWFRTPGRTGSDPGGLLVNPPKDVLLSAVGIPWSMLDRAKFTALVTNWGAWYESAAAPSSPARALSGVASLAHRSAQNVFLLTQVDAAAPGAEGLLSGYLAALTSGLGVDAVVTAQPAQKLPWLHAVRLIAASIPSFINPTLRGASKSAYLRKSYTPVQAGAMYDALNRTDFANPAGAVTLAGFSGGAINAVPPTRTALAHRDAAFWTLFETQWQDPAADAANIGWLRGLYGAVWSATGGYPVPGEQADGCYINNPDPDITDPAFNRSGVPWQTLYYKDNYPRLQRVKAAYDPRGVFRHAQSITAA